LLPNSEQLSLDEDELLKGHTYTILFGRDGYEIICPKMQDDGIESLAVPEFLIPGRPYPVYVYLYGIVLYSTNLEMGQREAAEKTRRKFGLETFSHTTLGRAMKKLEVRIITFQNKPHNEEAVPKNNSSFPSVEDTLKRRDTVISYLTEASEVTQSLQITLQSQLPFNYKQLPYEGTFFDVCHRIVRYTFKKYRSLLL